MPVFAQAPLNQNEPEKYDCSLSLMKIMFKIFIGKELSINLYNSPIQPILESQEKLEGIHKTMRVIFHPSTVL